MLKNPRLKYCYHAEFLDDDKVLLASEKYKAILSGKLYKLVLSEIRQEGIPIDELITKLEGKVSGMDVYYAIAALEKEGYLTEAASTMPEAVCAYWNSMGIDVTPLLEQLRKKTIVIETIGQLAPDVFRQAFDTIGIQTGQTGALKVIITDDYERKELRQINREAIEKSQPWMLVKPVGVELWIGPIFLPGKTGCWECLKQRLEINRPIAAFYRARKNSNSHFQIPGGHLPLSYQIAAGHSGIEIVKWLYFGKNESLEGKIVTIDTHSLSSRSHVLVKRPQCKTCGNPAYKEKLEPITLRKTTSCPETYGGGYREVLPDETIEKYRHHVTPITGIMPKLEPYHSIKGTPVYNYSSGRNTALRSKTLFWLNQHVRSGNGGKGKSISQAKVGALCEAIERYSLMYQGDEYFISGSLKDLSSNAVHPNRCMNYSAKQFQNREEENRNCSRFYSLVPIPFDESLKMDWTPVYSLTGKKFKYLPSCFCYAQYPAEDELNLFSYPDSNGCAAGNSLEEAILQGFLELVERDSVAIWWYNMLRKPGVDLGSFDDPYFTQLIDYYKSLNRSLFVLDITSDLNIPAFAAVSHRFDDKKENIIFGFGAHLDAKIAIERALVEINQILPIVNVPGVERSRGIYLTKDKNFVAWLNTATMANQPYFVPMQDIPKKTALDYPPLSEPNIYDSLIFCFDAATKQGLETLVLDLTRPDIGLPVVKVIVPGLRHFWKRLAPGRLYDVPVKMGWLKKPRREEQLNPVGLFI